MAAFLLKTYFWIPVHNNCNIPDSDSEQDDSSDFDDDI